MLLHANLKLIQKIAILTVCSVHVSIIKKSLMINIPYIFYYGANTHSEPIEE